MPSKKLYKKAKKGLKNIISPKKHKKVQEAINKPKLLSSEIMIKPTKVKISKAENIKKKVQVEKRKSLKTNPIEKELKRGNMFKKVFKKLEGKLNPKKNKIIGSKKLALLLTSGTILAILPMFNLYPLSALAVTSACIFIINFIAVKTLKKVIKQRSKTLAKSVKSENISVESAKHK